MKVLFVSIFWGVVLPFSTCLASVETAEQAVELLSIKNHVQNPFHIFNSWESSAEQLYGEQIDAIKFLGQTRDPHYTGILVSYLDYPSTPGAAIGDTIYARRQSIESSVQSAKTTWPAFGAIMDILGSERILSAYVLSETNPLDYRLTALLALKYKDSATYDKTMAQLKQANQANPNILKLLSVFQNQELRFCGLVNLETMEKISDRMQ